MNNETKRKLWKWGGFAVGFMAISFLFAPIAFSVFQGALGLLAFLAVFIVGNALLFPLTTRLANWRLKLIKEEAERNPIETMENQLREKQRSLVAYKNALERSMGFVKNFGSKLAKTKQEHPNSPEIPELEKNYNLQVRAIEHRRAKYREGQETLVKFERDVERQRDIWALILDARQMNEAMGADDSEKKFLEKLQMDTAHAAVASEMNAVFAGIELELEEEGQNPAQPPKAPTVKITPAVAAIALLMAVSASAQPTNTFIKGTMHIDFRSRVTPGRADVYTMNINVDNSIAFTGTISNSPVVMSLGFVKSPASLTHDINCEVINRNNPAQRKAIGRIYGTVPISPDGLYDYNAGSLGLSWGDQNSKFTGLAQGKPLIKKKAGLFERASKQVSELKRMVGGQVMALTITNYDNMTFQQTVMAGGPLTKYPQVTVNGEMKYDYDRLIWFFNNVQIGYYDQGRGIGDRLTGQITYDKKANEYVFDVRVNEPPVTESSSFGGGLSAKDESSFFAVDTTTPGLRGTMKYKDVQINDVTTASAVTIDLNGTQISQAQTMNLFKLIVLASIVPMNND
jgi:hypothetical protein